MRRFEKVRMRQHDSLTYTTILLTLQAGSLKELIEGV